MRFLTKFVLASAAALFLTGLVAPVEAAGAPRMSTAQIKQILAGNSVRQVDDQYRAYYANNGTVEAVYLNISQRGSWSVQNNQLCQKWQEWAGGKTQCYLVYKGTGGAYRFDDGRGNGFNFVLRQGKVLSR